MKILHTADWHLGAYVGPQCDDPMKRMENTIKCLDVLVETAKREGPDIILVAGDMFHQARTWNDRAMMEFRVAIDYLNALSHVAPVMVLYGTPNHDPIQSFYAMDEYFALKDVRFFYKPEIVTVDTKSGPIQIAGLPGFDKGYFRAQFPGLSAEEENQAFTQQLVQIVQGLSAQVDPAIPSILMAHHTVVGCELDNGQHVFQANEVVLPAAALDSSAFNMVCLGHIHRAQEINACYNPVFYSGSPDAFTFNDAGHDHGFWIHDLSTFQSPLTYEHRFIKTPAREFLTKKWSQEECQRAHEMNFAIMGFENKAVRVLYTCDAETEKALDKKRLERDLYDAGAYYVSEIRPESITATVNREGITEKLTVSECLDRYLKEKGMTESGISEVLSEAVEINAEASASLPMGTASGMFLPVEIEVKNYRSYAAEKFSFVDIFFAMVNGKNGSGKSSLFMDAITDCLYEKTRENELTGWIRNGEKSGSIAFTFKLGSDIWRVTRTRQRSGKATLALAKHGHAEYRDTGYQGDAWIDHSCERLADTQQKIIDLLGMDCDTFQSCVLIMQDRYGKFMEADKSERMAVLANLLGLSVYDDLLKITKDKLTEVNREIRTHKTEVEALEKEVASEDNLHTEEAQIAVELRTAQDDLTESKVALNNLQSKLGAIAGYEQEAARLENDLKSVTDQYTNKKAKKADLERRISETQSFLKNEPNILAKCAEIDKARLDIAALDGKVRLLNDKKIQYGKQVQELQKANHAENEIAQRLTAIRDRMKDKENLEAIVSSSTVEADLEQAEIKAQKYKEADRAALQLQMEKTNVERSGAAEIKQMEQKIEMLRNKTIMLADAGCVDIEHASCRFLKDALEAREQVKELETLYKSKKEDYSADLFEASRKLKSALDEREKIGYDKLTHELLLQDAKDFRAAKDKLASLAADAATADELTKQEVETAAKISDIQTEIKTLLPEIERLTSETNAVTELQARISQLAPYESNKQQIPKAKQFVESTSEIIQQLGADLDKLALDCKSINDRLAELRELTADKGTLYVNKVGAEKKAGMLEGIISQLNQQIGTINAELKVIAGKKVHLEEIREQLQQAAKQAAILEILSQAFSQDGIPYQIIRDIVPELEAAANEILSQMTGGRMRLEFVTERVLKSNKAKEVATLDIIINDVDNGVLPYLSRSGGQKVRCALSVSFALAIVKASRVGLQLGMLFIDEPPGLDEEGIEGYCSALETIHYKYPEMRILAISHDERMKARFAQQIFIETSEQGSRVRRA